MTASSRFLRFNAVSAAGFVIQLCTVALLTGWLALPAMGATAVGVAVAIVHNFLWHRRWTWADRFSHLAGGFAPADLPTRALAGSPMSRTVRVGSPAVAANTSAISTFVQFAMANGVVSILGNILIVGVLVETTEIHVVAANVVAVAICGWLNYQISDRMVFRSSTRSIVR